jgi:hypothetical protein
MGDAISRRAVVREIGGLLAGTALGGALIGGATIGGEAHAATVDVEDWLTRTDAQLAGLSKSDPDGPMARWLAARGHAGDLVPRLARGMLMVSAFRDLPHHVQEDARVQTLLRRESPALTRSLFEMTELLEGLSDAERAELTQALRDDPTLLDEVGERFDRAAGRRGVAEGRRTQLKGWLSTVGWQLRRRPSGAFLDELLGRADKACAAFGFARGDWRAAMERPAEGRGRDKDHGVSAGEEAALWIMGIGGVGVGLGLLLFVVGAAAQSDLTITGLLIGLVGLAVVAVGLIVYLIAVVSEPKTRNLSPHGKESEDEDEDGDDDKDDDDDLKRER